jgi:hypothetical protein
VRRICKTCIIHFRILWITKSDTLNLVVIDALTPSEGINCSIKAPTLNTIIMMSFTLLLIESRIRNQPMLLLFPLQGKEMVVGNVGLRTK